MARKIILGTYDTVINGPWTLAEGELSPAEYRTQFVEVPGRDGELDMSTALTDGVPRYGNRELVAEFMGRIKGAKPTDVTAEVNRLLKERRVSDISCNKVLWEILHENGYYAPTLSNWNSQIR